MAGVRRWTAADGSVGTSVDVDRLAAVVEEASQLADAESEPRLAISQVANLFAESLPRLLPTESRLAAHPAGERFFQGTVGDGTAGDTREAVRLAREQLQRTGFARETD